MRATEVIILGTTPADNFVIVELEVDGAPLNLLMKKMPSREEVLQELEKYQYPVVGSKRSADSQSSPTDPDLVLAEEFDTSTGWRDYLGNLPLGLIPDGLYQYCYSFIDAVGETLPSDNSGVLTVLSELDGTANVQGSARSLTIAISGEATCAGRNIYRREVTSYVGGEVLATGPWYLIYVIEDDATTAFTDGVTNAAFTAVLQDPVAENTTDPEAALTDPSVDIIETTTCPTVLFEYGNPPGFLRVSNEGATDVDFLLYKELLDAHETGDARSYIIRLADMPVCTAGFWTGLALLNSSFDGYFLGCYAEMASNAVNYNAAFGTFTNGVYGGEVLVTLGAVMPKFLRIKYDASDNVFFHASADGATWWEVSTALASGTLPVYLGVYGYLTGAPAGSVVDSRHCLLGWLRVLQGEDVFLPGGPSGIPIPGGGGGGGKDL